MSTQVPERLGPYRLVRKIGEGGMGVVHLGIDADGGQVAVKVLHPHVAADLKARDRLTREVETMRRVRSPNVAEVLDAELVGGQPYVVTRFAPGRTLEDTVLGDGPLEGRRLIKVIQGLCQALVAIHAAEVIHRDFKPSNVMLIGHEPLVIDFGIAHLVNATRLTQTGMFVGTPGYLAPEIIRDSEITQAADVHALASTVFFAATGVPPFGTGTFEAVCFNIMEGRAQLDKAPAWLRGWLSRALQIDAEARPSAQELLRMARRLDPSKTVFHEVPTASPASAAPPNGTRVLPAGDGYTDLLPPVEYTKPPRRSERKPPPAPRMEQPPPYIPAPLPHADRPLPHTDRRVAGYPTPPQVRPQSAPETRPRAYTPPGERKRFVVGSQLIGALLLVALVSFTVMMPVAIGVAAIAVAVVLRVGEYLFGDMVDRRRARGGGSSADPLLAVVGTPWALVKSALVTLVHVPLCLAFAACVWGILHWGAKMDVNPSAAWAAGAFTAGLFFLPGGGAPRKAVTRSLTGVLRTPSVALVAAFIAGTVAVLALMLAFDQPTDWAPWRAPEKVIEDLSRDARESVIGLTTGLIGDLLKEVGLGFLSPWSP
ncbi:hypothetical protein GCM10009560_20110 [Nonomuraea longicatena]|uniref:Protein kinase domain-containing protein n=2 Tax=Nonomuraea longicatena TaxID=83682 RepID=A0ABN1P1R2_9ACTN